MQSGAPRDATHPHPMMMSTREKERYIENFPFPYCDESVKYEKITKIGQGTFGYTVETINLALE